MRSRQGGWAGLIGLVLALVIVALLAKTLLGQLGVLGADRKTTSASHSPSAATAPASAAEAAAIPPGEALKRARGLEKAVQEQARQEEARIDRMTQP
jgi:hypothetical protein